MKLGPSSMPSFYSRIDWFRKTHSSNPPPSPRIFFTANRYRNNCSPGIITKRCEYIRKLNMAHRTNVCTPAPTYTQTLIHFIHIHDMWLKDGYYVTNSGRWKGVGNAKEFHFPWKGARIEKNESEIMSCIADVYTSYIYVYRHRTIEQHSHTDFWHQEYDNKSCEIRANNKKDLESSI